MRFGFRPNLIAPQGVSYGAFIARVRAAGLGILVTLYGGRRVWGDVLRSDQVDVGVAFADFAAQVMQRHLDDVDMWEIWNEPDHKTFLAPESWRAFDDAVGILCRRIGQMPRRPTSILAYGFAAAPKLMRIRVLDGFCFSNMQSLAVSLNSRFTRIDGYPRPSLMKFLLCGSLSRAMAFLKSVSLFPNGGTPAMCRFDLRRSKQNC